MAVCIKGVSRAKDQEFIKTWIQQRFMTSRTKLSLSANPKSVHLKSTKPSFTQRNSYFKLMNGTHYSSTANFHHLAINILINDVPYITNMGTRNYAKDNKNRPTISSLDKYISDVNETYANENLEKELSRLRRTGAMKDIPTKIPEGIQGIKGTDPKH